MADEDHDAGRADWAVLVAASSGALLCFLNLSALNVALPAVARSLHASPAQASWILLSYMLVSTVCILSFGRLADLWGRRRLFLAGLWLFVAACAACALAPTAELMLASRIAQAVGAAGVMANASALVGDAFGRRRMGLALGVLAMVAALAQVVGPLAGGFVVSWWGWRVLFMLNVPIGLGVLAWSWKVLPRNAAAGAERFDLAGAALSLVGIGCVTYALSMAGTRGWTSTPVWAFMLAGLCAIALFSGVQMRVASPLVDPSLFSDPARRTAYACILLLSMTQAAPLLLIALYLQACAGLQPSQAGLRIAPVAFGMLMAAPLAGAMTRRFRPESICVAGMLLAGCALALLAALLQPAIGAVQLSLCLWVLGLGIGSFVTPNNTSILQSVAPRRRGIANGVRSTLQNTGIMIGTALTLSVAMAQLPSGSQRMILGGGAGLSNQDVAAFTQGASHALVVLAVLCLAGAALIAASLHRNASAGPAVGAGA
ncbi:DHA2 family efflux MFS transporter permease subunit [Variovorax paradoxus]|jgi:EmrB/QacA subfamily drug resistance transporter|uniref:DHA2 family efflux MFS transporter permease subunit n=1 Tax=Variovorax paradoxus TaxID=34073 RepID=UPI0029C8A0DA|nr:DHA2 family efflux MFS transporter permease subunit [Variovorax paradoxus]WPH23593.1 DHA2 family efflux MFS transporter permease subunit [Variovorax paradoxus]